MVGGSAAYLSNFFGTFAAGYTKGYYLDRHGVCVWTLGDTLSGTRFGPAHPWPLTEMQRLRGGAKQKQEPFFHLEIRTARATR